MNRMLVAVERAFDNRYFVAIKKAFTITLPLILLGSLASLLNNLPVGFIQTFLATPVGEWIRGVNGGLWLGTTAILALIMLASLAYYLALEYGLNGILAALTALASYVAICVITPDGGIDLARLGAGGLFGAIVIAVLALELYRLFSRMGMAVRVGDNVPAEVTQMFEALVPVALTVLSVCMLDRLLALTGMGINQWLYTILAAPFQLVGEGIASALAMVFGVHIFWFFGIHGGNVLNDVVEKICGTGLADNAALFAQTGNAFDGGLVTINKAFLDVFVYMGGAGTTLCLILSVLLVGRSRYLKTVGRMGGVFSIFNINELILFGLPVILNPLLFVPFVGTPLLLTFVSWSATQLGWVAHTVVENVHWAMPPVISGYLATGGHLSGAVLQLINIAIGTLIYLPFVRMVDRRVEQQEKSGQGQMERLENTLLAVVGKVRHSTSHLNQDISGFSMQLGQVSEQLQQVSREVADQMELLRHVTHYAEEISGSVDQVNRSVDTVLANASDTLQISCDGAGVVAHTTQQMEQIQQETQAMNELATVLAQRTEQIRSFLKTIEGIAQQTNILSLNASVEAARAGSAGRGFAVVAGEIKKLSGISQKAVEDITQLLQSVELDTGAISDRCQSNTQQVSRGQQYIHDTSQLFEQIGDSVQEMKGSSEQVATATHRITQELEQIRQQIHTTNQAFDDTAYKTGQVSAKVQEKSHRATVIVQQLQQLEQEISSLAEDIGVMEEQSQ